MHESPLLTPTNFVNNNKKRSRASIDDSFDFHYLKKRLISTMPNLMPFSASANTANNDNRTSFSPNLNKSLGGGVTLSPSSPMEEENTSIYKVQIDDAKPYHNQIHLLDINGTILPMEQKPGETKYSIPGFVLSNNASNKPLQTLSGQLILYEKNSIFAAIEKDQQHLQIDDNDSMTSEENDEEYDPMDLE